MNYQNAKKGIGQIYKAELLTIIATIIGIIGAIVFLAAGEKGSEGGMAAGGIPILIAGIMFIIAFIINLVGLSNASKDEPYFKTAWIIALIAIAASVVQSILDMRGIKVEWLFELISNICEIMIMIFVITGIGKIADTLGNKKVSRLSRRTTNVTCGVYVLSARLSSRSSRASCPSSPTCTICAHCRRAARCLIEHEHTDRKGLPEGGPFIALCSVADLSRKGICSEEICRANSHAGGL